MEKTGAEAIDTFIELSGDDNPIHQDAEYAQSTGLFEDRVVAGVHALSWVSAKLADYGNGETILLGFDNVSFDNPIYVDDDVSIECEYHPEWFVDQRIGVNFTITNETADETAVTGEATVIVTNDS